MNPDWTIQFFQNQFSKFQKIVRKIPIRFEPVALFMSSPGVTAMVQHLVAGLVVVALIIMGMLAYAQKHEGCLHGRSLETFQPCGSVSIDM
jgi:hypothetical protein